ncbi:O-sialoglycoprotein endopeptidase/protein kinase [Pseudoloma neurophilia]|uniref:non-specific serine/threonine protein kinase n=1 Tax=Pseudoloma neurophilia TaxID=146866 RepID=A0A0R0M3G8_9MICR|nr:O-sialoglycoprotein endopeptidase/protein kinase [Pseudoloma neurophilia]
MELIYHGSESLVYKHENKLFKFRQSKSYRLPELDKKLREKRTSKEIRILEKLAENKVTVPVVLEQKEIRQFIQELEKLQSSEDEKDIKSQKITETAKITEAEIITKDEKDTKSQKLTEAEIIIEEEKDTDAQKNNNEKSLEKQPIEEKLNKNLNLANQNSPVKLKKHVDTFQARLNSTIAMSYIHGTPLSKKLLSNTCSKNTLIELGNVLSIIHEIGIIHGDITPSNVILREEQVFVIDFGLSYFSFRLEDRAVDVWMFEKILRSLYSNCKIIDDLCDKPLIDHFLDGYLQNLSSHENFLSKLSEVRERGRKIGC